MYVCSRTVTYVRHPTTFDIPRDSKTKIHPFFAHPSLNCYAARPRRVVPDHAHIYHRRRCRTSIDDSGDLRYPERYGVGAGRSVGGNGCPHVARIIELKRVGHLHAPGLPETQSPGPWRPWKLHHCIGEDGWEDSATALALCNCTRVGKRVTHSC